MELFDLSRELADGRSWTDSILLDGQLHEVRTNPFTTVLDYLRDVLGRRGSKEGCAEGDCGAYRVLSEVHHGRLRYRAVNSCIQLVGSLDGKELLIVESLGAWRSSSRSASDGRATRIAVWFLYAWYRDEFVRTVQNQPIVSREQVDECLS